MGKKTQKEPISQPKVGRPVGYRKAINLELLKRMAARHCTLEEMADCLGCSTVTLRNNYFNIIQEEKAQGKLNLRDWQWRILEKGSADMAKWLGRAILKQNESGDPDDNQKTLLANYTGSVEKAREEYGKKDHEEGSPKTSSDTP